MKTAFVIFDQMTALDFVGVFDPLTRLKTMDFLPDFAWEVCARSGEVRDGKGLCFTPGRAGGSFEGFDMIVLPGGSGTRALVDDEEFIGWIRTARGCAYKVSVCTGSLLLGAAGFLEGKSATTHPAAFADLRRFVPEVSTARIVDEGEVITAGGVTSSIDLGLYLCEKFAGPEARRRIQRQMDYPYETAPAR